MLNNIIENNLKEHDFEGTKKDLEGRPVPNGRGGYFDHAKEMRQSYEALNKVKKGLEGSVKNPNLSRGNKQVLDEALYKTNCYLDRVAKVFEPYGGAK